MSTELSPVAGLVIFKAKFFGPTNSRGSRYRIAPVRGCTTLFGREITKPTTVTKDYRFSLIYDQMESYGLIHLFDDEQTGWSYFSQMREG